MSIQLEWQYHVSLVQFSNATSCALLARNSIATLLGGVPMYHTLLTHDYLYHFCNVAISTMMDDETQNPQTYDGKLDKCPDPLLHQLSSHIYHN